MFVVSNRIHVASGHGRTAPRLHPPGDSPSRGDSDGRSPAWWLRLSRRLTYWERKENFVAWTNGEDFRTAHADKPPEGLLKEKCALVKSEDTEVSYHVVCET